MMMNFKKNQNNAVCSMDCKNCPHGASQPNPMDDSMFEKSIAMLHNWLMLEAIREDHPKERIVMVILPGDRKSTRLNSSHKHRSRMPSSA